MCISVPVFHGLLSQICSMIFPAIRLSSMRPPCGLAAAKRWLGNQSPLGDRHGYCGILHRFHGKTKGSRTAALWHCSNTMFVYVDTSYYVLLICEFSHKLSLKLLCVFHANLLLFLTTTAAHLSDDSMVPNRASKMSSPGRSRKARPPAHRGNCVHAQSAIIAPLHQSTACLRKARPSTRHVERRPSHHLHPSCVRSDLVPHPLPGSTWPLPATSPGSPHSPLQPPASNVSAHVLGLAERLRTRPPRVAQRMSPRSQS